MVNRALMRQVSDEDLESELEKAFGGQTAEEDLVQLYNMPSQRYEVGAIVSGKVTRIVGADVMVDIGYKSEGIVQEREWDEDEAYPTPGEVIEVLLESVEDDKGIVTLSKRKAKRIRAWEKIINEYHEGDVVTGLVTRKVKGGLLIDIGANVFLPASQVDVRRPNDIGEFIGQHIQCLILKIDVMERNIVVSRRQLIEQQREDMKRKLFEDIAVGQKRKGVVKNIASFGAFVDLGGVDGLLHVSDMSWSRVSHPSDMVAIDDELEVVILNIDRERERIAVGLKQVGPSPWENIEERYPVGSKVTGEVVNVMNYGAFVKVEEGIEGLVHISEMSWTKRINHPSELVQVGDQVEVVVLDLKPQKHEISLGMKQTRPNPWDEVAEKYPPGTLVKGVVRNLTNYGAFVEIEEGVDGLLHVSDISWVRKINHPNEVLEKGAEIECQVVSVDQERKRIALGMKQLKDDPWATDIPARYQSGQVVKGKVTKITSFGVFVELEPDLEGLLHVSELAGGKVENPKDVVKVGDELECRVLRVDVEERKIGLSRKLVDDEQDDAVDEATGKPKSKARELKGGTGAAGGLLINMTPAAPAEEKTEEKTEEMTEEAKDEESAS